VILKNDKHELIDYIEKPEHKSFVSIGVNVLSKECRRYVQAHEFLGMPDLMLRMKEAGEKVCCYEVKTTWLDLGRLDDFELSQEVFLKNRKKYFC